MKRKSRQYSFGKGKVFERDNPIKIIIDDNPTVFCHDFLGLDIKSARPVPNELKNRARHADILLEMTLPDDSLELSHIEVQGMSSRLPMATRIRQV